MPRSETIPVRLLTDVVGYGRKGTFLTSRSISNLIMTGTIIAVAPARMRNVWYPSKNAQYMTQAEIKQAKQQDIVRERDMFFGRDSGKKGLKRREKPPIDDISITVLSVSWRSLYFWLV